MLTKIKNVAGGTPTLPASTSDAVKAQVDLKNRQMRRGTTRTKVEELTSELETERRALDRARQTVAEREIDGLDTTEAAAALQRVEGRVRVLEVALPVAQQKHEAALVAETQAKQQAAIEAEVAAVAHLKRVGLKVDKLLSDLEHLVADEVGPAMNAARDVLSSSGIRSGELYFIAEAPSAFKQLLFLAAHSLIKEGFVPVTMRKYQQWSNCIPDEDFIRSRTREAPPTVKDIPSWQAEG